MTTATTSSNTLGTWIFLGVIGFIGWQVLNKKPGHAEREPKFDGWKKGKRGSLNAVGRNSMFVADHGDKKVARKDMIPSSGSGKHRVYVEYVDKGGIDHYFKSAGQAKSFRTKMNKRYNNDDANIYKVR
jgi:hypothetical protein